MTDTPLPTPEKSITEKKAIGAAIPVKAIDQRILRWLAAELSFNIAQRLLRKGLVRLNGKRVRDGGYRLQQGDYVWVPAEYLATLQASSDEIISIEKHKSTANPLAENVLYQDESLLVLNKPAGLAVQGGTGVRRNVDSLLQRWARGADFKPRLVHRLDQDTSGILLVALTPAAARHYAAMFKEHQAQKTYLAVVTGRPQQRTGNIDLPLLRHTNSTVGKVVASPDGKPASTSYTLLERNQQKGVALLELMPKTGRTHQLRVHCATPEGLDAPILGDRLYGPFQGKGHQQATPMHLHAYEIALPDIDGITQRFTAPLPKHFANTLHSYNWRGIDGG